MQLPIISSICANGECGKKKRNYLNHIRVAFLMVLCLTAGSMTSWAQAVYYPSFSITLDACDNKGVGNCGPGETTPQLSDPLILVNGPSFLQGDTYGFNGSLSGEYSGPVPTIADTAGPFSFLPTGTMMLGVLDYLPSDGQTPTDHVVLFVNSSIASSLVGQTWDSLFDSNSQSFENFTEADIVNDLEDPGSNFTSLINFMTFNEDLLANPNGASIDAVAFSNGLVVGTGTTELDTVGSNAPEPSTPITLAFGIGGIAFLKRRWRAAA